MIVALPVCTKDEHLAVLGLRVARKLDASVPFECVIVHERGHDVSAIADLAKDYFKDVSTLMYEPCPYGKEFPKPHNWAWQHTARFMATQTKPWLWWEPDACPTRAGWLTTLATAYKEGRKPFAGPIERNNRRPYLVGVAIYPHDVAVRCEKAMITRQGPFDQVLSWLDNGLGQTANIGNLIHHDFRVDGKGRTWHTPAGLPMEVVLWHRCEDGSLHKWLLEGAEIHEELNAPINIPAGNVGIVQLGRVGDILNILPVAKFLSVTNHHRPTPLVVHETMLPVLSRVGYVKAIGWPGEINDPQAAVAAYEKQWDTALAPQLFSKTGLEKPQYGSYNKAHYHKCGLYGRFDVVSLELDKRNWEVEDAWLAKVRKTTKPLICYNLIGYSSPFPQATAVLDLLREFEDDVELLDLNKARTECFTDQLVALDTCAALVTVDTATLHLANASHCPVLAFISNTDDDNWYGTVPMRKLRWECRYREAATRLGELRQQLRDCIAARTAPQGRVWHVVHRRLGDFPRVQRAEATWNKLYAEGVCRPFHIWSWKRNAIDHCGDKRCLPFMRDALELAVSEMAPKDIFIYTNDDIVLLPKAVEQVCMKLRYTPLVTSFRFDTISFDQLILKERHCGRDLYATTAGWLKAHYRELPDFFIGASEWDLVMAVWARKLCGKKADVNSLYDHFAPCELSPGLVWHEMHGETWNRPDNIDTAPSQLHNRLLAEEWFRANAPLVKLHWFKNL